MVEFIDILFIIALGGINFNYLNSGSYLKSIKSAFSAADKERKIRLCPFLNSDSDIFLFPKNAQDFELNHFSSIIPHEKYTLQKL